MLAGRIAKYKLRMRKLGKQCAAKIQSFWRRYVQLDVHRRLGLEAARPARIEGSLRIQRQIRAFLGRKHARQYKAARTRATILVQKRFRGYVVRTRMLRLRAGRRVYKFVKRLRFFKYRDVVIMTVQVGIGGGDGVG